MYEFDAVHSRPGLTYEIAALCENLAVDEQITRTYLHRRYDHHRAASVPRGTVLR